MGGGRRPDGRGGQSEPGAQTGNKRLCVHTNVSCRDRVSWFKRIYSQADLLTTDVYSGTVAAILCSYPPPVHPLFFVPRAPGDEFVRVHAHLRRLPKAKPKKRRTKVKVQKTTLDKWLIKMPLNTGPRKHQDECGDRQLAFTLRMEEMRLLLGRL